jgi:hypothetical protein
MAENDKVLVKFRGRENGVQVLDTPISQSLFCAFLCPEEDWAISLALRCNQTALFSSLLLCSVLGAMRSGLQAHYVQRW